MITNFSIPKEPVIMDTNISYNKTNCIMQHTIIPINIQGICVCYRLLLASFANEAIKKDICK